ncbi:hypothetical protein ACEWY4_020912 [Coilia grayii]|uniref:Homeobox domain-containing protein n=1 Tax=Coilia grayii TaxID=363190 RepID=A0ABD1J8K8_9TELE
MAKHFSVEWLSQSSHSQGTDTSVFDGRIHSNTDNYMSYSCGYTSSSESEVGDHVERECGSNRRVRTKFTTDQIFRLEKTFNKHKYLGVTQRRKIAEKLHLSETQVKTWFQNRRMKLKREVQDLRAEYLAPSILPSLVYPTAAAFQHHGIGGQLLAFPSTVPQVYPRSVQTIPAQHFQPRPQPAVHPVMLASRYY